MDQIQAEADAEEVTFDDLYELLQQVSDVLSIEI
jgi:hypothetical protein